MALVALGRALAAVQLPGTTAVEEAVGLLRGLQDPGLAPHVRAQEVEALLLLVELEIGTNALEAALQHACECRERRAFHALKL